MTLARRIEAAFTELFTPWEVLYVLGRNVVNVSLRRHAAWIQNQASTQNLAKVQELTIDAKSQIYRRCLSRSHG